MPKKKQTFKYPKEEEYSSEKKGKKRKNLSLNARRKHLKTNQIKLI